MIVILSILLFASIILNLGFYKNLKKNEKTLNVIMKDTNTPFNTRLYISRMLEKSK